MNGAIRFLTSASWPLLMVGSAVLGVLTTLVIFSAAIWSQHRSSFQAYQQAQQVYARHMTTPEWSKCEAAITNCIAAQEARGDLADYTPAYCRSRLERDAGCPYRPYAPESYSELWGQSLSENLGRFSLLCIAAAAALLAFVALTRAFVADSHPGWRRVAIISPAVGLLAGWWIGWEEHGEMTGEVVAYTVGGAFLCFAVFVVGRRITVWVLEGFGRAAPLQPLLDTPPSAENALPNVKSPALSGKAGKRLAIGATAAVALLIHFVVNPERALETTVGAVFTVVGLVLVVYVFRRISEAIDYWRG